MANIGKIVQVIGPVLDVKFDSEKSLPNLLNALVIKQGDKEIVAEVAQKTVWKIKNAQNGTPSGSIVLP